MEKQQIEIYQSQDGTAQVEVRFEQDTLWLSHETTIRKFRMVRQEGSRKVNREIRVKLEKDTVWLSQSR